MLSIHCNIFYDISNSTDKSKNRLNLVMKHKDWWNNFEKREKTINEIDFIELGGGGNIVCRGAQVDSAIFFPFFVLLHFLLLMSRLVTDYLCLDWSPITADVSPGSRLLMSRLITNFCWCLAWSPITADISPGPDYLCLAWLPITADVSHGHRLLLMSRLSRLLMSRLITDYCWCLAWSPITIGVSPGHRLRSSVKQNCQNYKCCSPMDKENNLCNHGVLVLLIIPVLIYSDFIWNWEQCVLVISL